MLTGKHNIDLTAHCFINRQRFTTIFMFPVIHRLPMYVKCTKPSPFESFVWQNYKPTKAPIMGLLQNSTLNVPKGLSSYIRFEHMKEHVFVHQKYSWLIVWMILCHFSGAHTVWREDYIPTQIQLKFLCCRHIFCCCHEPIKRA